MSDMELGGGTCPKCGHESYVRDCDCEDGKSFHDCGNDCCVCLNPIANVKCDRCAGTGSLEWCRRCAWDFIEKRFLNGYDERTPAEVLEDRRAG